MNNGIKAEKTIIEGKPVWTIMDVMTRKLLARNGVLRDAVESVEKDNEERKSEDRQN